MIRHLFRPMFNRAFRPVAVATLCVLPCGAQENVSNSAAGIGQDRGPLAPESIVVKMNSASGIEKVAATANLVTEMVTSRRRCGLA